MKKITIFTLFYISVIHFAQGQVALTSFEEAPIFSGVQYVDTGNAAVAHDLVNNVNEPNVDYVSTGTEIGWNATYIPYDTPDVGLTDGDFVGVTDFIGDVSAYTDGTQGYQMSDVDGNMIVEFDIVDFSLSTNNEVSVDYFVNGTGWEGDGTVNDSGNDRIRIYIRDLTNTTEIDILNTEGSDIDDLMIEDSWITGSVAIPDNVMVQLVVEFRSNSGAEALYLDNVLFETNVLPPTLELAITELFPGQMGTDLTADWFEIENIGTIPWTSGVDPDLFYDDESADPTVADLIQGLIAIEPGERVIVLVTGDTNDITTFTAIWSPVIDLTNIEIGYTDGSGLGGGGDAVTIWLGDPTMSMPIASAAYPDTTSNDGQSYDAALAAFSVVGNASNAVETLALGGTNNDTPNIGSPGNTALPPLFDLVVSEIFPGQSGADLTEDWFEIQNNGTVAWVSGVDPDLYYDDDSSDPGVADLIEGITDIQPGERVIILITGDTNDINTFTDVWSPVVDLSNTQIGYTDGSGLGGGGDAVTIWVGDPTVSMPVDIASYPDTTADDGKSYDGALAAFSEIGNANGAVATIALGGTNGDIPNIGSPGEELIVAPPVSVAFSAAFTAVAESDNIVEISVTPSEAPTIEGTIDIVLLSAGTAIEGVHFNYPVSETITFPVGQTGPQTFSIPITNNSNDNSDLFFVLELQNAVDVEIIEQDSFSVFILDDDTEVPQGDDTELNVTLLNSYLVDPNGTAEISAFDPDSELLFVTNGDSIEVLDFSDPVNPLPVATVLASDLGGDSFQSVAVANGIVAFAVGVDPATDPGFVVLANAADGSNMVGLSVGVLPDMVTFSPDNNLLLVANEGQPSDDYTIDPEGSVSVIDVSGGLAAIDQSDVTTLNFNAFDAQQAMLEAAGVRIFGPGATVSQDLEPEYVAVSANSEKAYVSLQENNAYAIIDLVNLEVTDIISFGLKDHSDFPNTIDTSDETNFIFDANWPIYGMYMPDAIAYYEANGISYIVTANEGDARDYGGYAEERKLDDADYILDSTVFSNADVLEQEYNLGDINVSVASGDTDNDGDFDEIHVYGARSFSIFEAETGVLVFDSGNDFETIIANDPVYSGIFNASNSNNNFKNRSDNKGPEPEGVTVQEIDGETYAFVLLERIGGVMIYNITDPSSPQFLEYENNRDATPGGNEMGDLGPEGVIYVSPEESPTDKGLLIVSNEVSATIAVYQIENDILSTPSFDVITEELFSMYPNPANKVIYLSKPGDYKMYDLVGRLIKTVTNTAVIKVNDLSTGTYLVRNAKGDTQKLLVR